MSCSLFLFCIWVHLYHFLNRFTFEQHHKFFAICNNMYEPTDYHPEWSKPTPVSDSPIPGIGAQEFVFTSSGVMDAAGPRTILAFLLSYGLGYPFMWIWLLIHTTFITWRDYLTQSIWLKVLFSRTFCNMNVTRRSHRMPLSLQNLRKKWD